MSQYLKLFEALRSNFQKVDMVRVLKSQNNHADSLATLALSLDECVPRMIFVELLKQPSIEQRAVIASALVSKSSWLDHYVAFLSDGSLPTDAKEAEKVQRTSAHFWSSKDKKLYRCSFGGPILLCLHSSKATKLIVKLHEGISRGHLGGRSLSHQAMTRGFWLPNMQCIAADYVRKCDQC